MTALEAQTSRNKLTMYDELVTRRNEIQAQLSAIGSAHKVSIYIDGVGIVDLTLTKHTEFLANITANLREQLAAYERQILAL